jgi:hypothetical protein
MDMIMMAVTSLTMMVSAGASNDMRRMVEDALPCDFDLASHDPLLSCCLLLAAGITHHTFEAILTTPVGHDAYGRMDFYSDCIELVGTDLMTGFQMSVPAKPLTAADTDSTTKHKTDLPPKL